jgi:hypothetical protein
LQQVGDNDPYGSGRVGVPVGSTLTAWTTLLCSVGGDVRIRGARLVRASGLRLIGWGTAPFPPLEIDTLHSGGLRRMFTTDPVRQRCDSRPQQAAQFDVTLRTTAPIAVTHGIRIDYPGGTVYVPIKIFFCSAAECPGSLEHGSLP